VYELSKMEAHILALLCDYLIGDEYIWEIAYLFCLLQMAGKKSGVINSLSAIVPGAPKKLY